MFAKKTKVPLLIFPMCQGKQVAYDFRIGLKAWIAILSDGDNKWLFMQPSNSYVSALKKKSMYIQVSEM